MRKSIGSSIGWTTVSLILTKDGTDSEYMTDITSHHTPGPYGDLNGLYHTYRRENIPIPEPILWMIFQKLVEQCLIMEKGSVLANTSIPGWRQIVHRDIKPENVFVDVPSTNGFFPAYPTPKMADFGFAFETSPQDPTNPDQWSRAGTRPYLAPEQMGLSVIEDPNEAPVGIKLLAHTNVS